MWTRAELIQLILDRERKADAPPQPEPLNTMEQMRQRNLADARAGKCITMNALARSVPRPRPPRKPSIGS